MAYLLDTCVFAEFSNLRPRLEVTDWTEQQPLESLFMSVITLGEIEKGIVRLPSSKRRTGLEALLETLLLRFDTRIIPLYVPVLRRWARMIGDLEKKGRILPVLDSMIAATALEHDLTIVTRNTEDFATANVSVLNIWK